jgi:hypothetical protein
MISLSIVLDTSFLLQQYRNKKGSKEMLLAVIFTSFFLTSAIQFNQIKGYIYEIAHVYKGPMDYVIPFIKSNFQNSENLVIATNYEEHVLMYYLGSKVTVGFVGNNIEEDSEIIPDIIIARRGRPNNIEILKNFLNKNTYEKITFPIYDYPYNNIPELTLPESHLYKTRLAENEKDKLTIYVRK